MINRRLTLLCTAGTLACLPLTLHAQQAAPAAPAAPADTFSVVAQDTRDTPDGHAIYTLRATTADPKQTGQKIRLTIHSTSSTGTLDRLLTINTGKYKSVAQMEALVASILRQFVAGNNPPGKELGKIGDVRYGGEIRFVAESAESLRYEIVTPEGPAGGGGHFNRTQAQAFLGLLTRTATSAPAASGG